jgi:hypothetical protein
MAHVKNANIPTDYSNKWNFFIDIEKIKRKEIIDLEKVYTLINNKNKKKIIYLFIKYI